MKFARLAVEQDPEAGLNIFERDPCRVSYTTAAEDRRSVKTLGQADLLDSELHSLRR
jgi:hypothetical protein